MTPQLVVAQLAKASLSVFSGKILAGLQPEVLFSSFCGALVLNEQ